MYFSPEQVSVFGIVAALHLISIYYFTYSKKIKYALLFLLAGGIIARLLLIDFDNFFHTWDEQYHALVAKNLSESPLVPMLYKDTPLPYNPNAWASNHIWLHKQPLFLWQMALSIKVFGLSTFAVRLPSVIMMSLLVLIIFRIGKIAINEQVGYISAFLFATHNYFLEFVTGIYSTDHNDIAFIFYIALSIWAYSEYTLDKKPRYVWLIGLFAGLAVLNKWLVGLIVFAGWALTLFFVSGVENKKIELKNILIAFLICLLTFLPWQIYILIRFPVESKFEYSLNSLHFFESVEGHAGNYWYYFEQAIIQYGYITALILPIALVVLFREIKVISVRINFMALVIITYLFFTLAETKMAAFCLIASPIMFLALGNLLNIIFSQVKLIKANEKVHHAIGFLILGLIGFASMDIEAISQNHTMQTNNGKIFFDRTSKMQTIEFVQSIKGKYDPEKTIVFNCSAREHIPIMFFSNYTSYDRMPTFKEYDHLKRNGYRILLRDDNAPHPGYFATDNTITVITDTGRTERKKLIHIMAMNGKYVCADQGRNEIVFAGKEFASGWETFLLTFLDDSKCTINTDENLFLCAELNQQNEITATRKKASAWETFSITYLDSGLVSFKAVNDKYLTFDESINDGQLFARSNSIGKSEKFRIVFH